MKKRTIAISLIIIISIFAMIFTASAIENGNTTEMIEVQDMSTPEITIELPGQTLEMEHSMCPALEYRPSLQKQPEHWPDHLQDYIPGSISLFCELTEVFNGQSERVRRETFYLIDGFIIDLVPHDEWVVFRDTILRRGDDTMPLLQFIKHFNISREVMETALIQMNEARIGVIDYVTNMMKEEQLLEEMLISTEISSFANQSNRDMTSWPWYDPLADIMHEFHELPNLDVIFTFDNEIINWYYRRG